MDGNMASSFLGLEGLHVFVTGAGGGIGSEVVREFMGKSKGFPLLGGISMSEVAINF